MNIDTFWGKLNKEAGTYHSLVDHSLDVAFCGNELLRLPIIGKRLSSVCGIGYDDFCKYINHFTVLIGLHDIGKFNHGFQNKASDSLHTSGHVKEVMMLLQHSCEISDNLFEALGFDDIFVQWSEDENRIIQLLWASICHHGKPVSTSSHEIYTKSDIWSNTVPNWRGNNLCFMTSPMNGIGDLMKRLLDVFLPNNLSTNKVNIPYTNEFVHAFSGLVMLADWIASDVRFFPFSQKGEDRSQTGLKYAKNAITKLFLDTQESVSFLSQKQYTFEDITGKRPRPLQKYLMDLDIVEDKPSLLLLEAETGSGKTEAAFAHFMQLFRKGLVDSMYFALPTRTAATQIYNRIVNLIESVFPEIAIRPPVILAVPGYLHKNDSDAPISPILWNDSVDNSRFWASENSKRYLSGCVVIGTIDQLLLSGIQSNHAHLRGFSSLRSLLIVDEIHSSDEFMQSLLQYVLQRHHKAKGHTLLMSATVRYELKKELFSKITRTQMESLSLEQCVTNIPYPSVSGYLNGTLIHTAIEQNSYQKRIIFDLSPTIEFAVDVAKSALDHARKGAKVLVIRNTVQGCLEVQHSIESIMCDSDRELLFTIKDHITCHHSRFATGDRKILDRGLEQRFVQPGGCIIVATQTVEQSLDLDADLVITDLCPIDVLLQRVGRLHRKEKEQRPTGYTEARCIVLVPQERDLLARFVPNKTKKYTLPNGFGSVYENLLMMETTWRVLESVKARTIEIPKENRWLIEQSLHPDVLRNVESEDERWKVLQRMLFVRSITSNQQASHIHLDWTKEYIDSFPAKDVDQNIVTRLGANDRTVSFVESFVSCFGNRITELKIPDHLCLNIDVVPEKINHIQENNGVVTFQLGTNNFQYSRLGLEKIKNGQKTSD